MTAAQGRSFCSDRKYVTCLLIRTEYCFECFFLRAKDFSNLSRTLRVGPFIPEENKGGASALAGEKSVPCEGRLRPPRRRLGSPTFDRNFTNFNAPFSRLDVSRTSAQNTACDGALPAVPRIEHRSHCKHRVNHGFLRRALSRGTEVRRPPSSMP